MKISMDESGNTGLDLLNADQPLFALASTSVTDDRAWELLEPLLRQNQGEVKYSRLKRTASGRKALLELFGSSYFNDESFSVQLAEKKFVLSAQIVDKLVEPVFYEFGIDVYGRGLNIWMAIFCTTSGRTRSEEAPGRIFFAPSSAHCETIRSRRTTLSRQRSRTATALRGATSRR